MNENRLLNMNSWYETFLESCDTDSLDFANDFNKDNFIEYFCRDLIGESYVANYNKYIKFENAYNYPLLSDMLENLRGQYINGYGLITSYSIDCGGMDNTTEYPETIPGNYGTKLIKYQDLLNKPKDLFGLYGLSCNLLLDTVNNNNLTGGCHVSLYVETVNGTTQQIPLLEYYNRWNSTAVIDVNLKNLLLIENEAKQRINNMGDAQLKLNVLFDMGDEYTISKCLFKIPQYNIEKTINAPEEYNSELVIPFDFSLINSLNIDSFISNLKNGNFGIKITPTFEKRDSGGTGGDVEGNARLYWEDFQFVGCTGARINLDDYYMTPIVNEGVDIYSDYSFSVTHATRAPFSAGTDSNGAYIDIPKTSLSDFERSENCFVGVKFATSNNIGSPYNSMWVLFPVTITGSKNIITGEWDEEGMQARVWLEEGRMEFSNLTTYEAGFDISHCYEGETQVFVEPNSDGEYYFMYGFCDKIYIAAIGDTYTRAYGIAGVSDYNVSTSFYGASSVRLMPSNISNITNIFYWHQYTVQKLKCKYKIQNG